MKKGGYYATYVNQKTGNTVMCEIRYEDQKPAFSNHGKVFFRSIDSNFQPVRDKDNKALIGVKDIDKLTVIGYFD